jgi:hypothetical protein
LGSGHILVIFVASGLGFIIITQTGAFSPFAISAIHCQAKPTSASPSHSNQAKTNARHQAFSVRPKPTCYIPSSGGTILRSRDS